MGLLQAERAQSQFVQYTAPGSLRETQTPTREDFENALSDARWRWGALRLTPWYELKDVGYNSNVFGSTTNQQSDFNVTAGAGLRAYVPVGSKVNLAIHALPEYVWWNELENRRRLNGRYGAGLFGYFDRLTMDVEGTYAEQQSYANSELEQPINTVRQRVKGGAEFSFYKRLSVFGSGETEQWRYDEADITGQQGARLVALDRRENVARGGLRYRFESGFLIGAGVERSVVDFSRPELDRSNEGTSPLLEIQWLPPQINIDAAIAFRKLEPKGESLFQSFDGVTGRFLFGWRPGATLTYQLYARNDLVYTIFEEASYYENQRVGGAVIVPIRWRIRARCFYEWGKDDYRMFDPTVTQRSDDVTAYGITGAIQMLTEGLELQLGVSRIRYESNIPGRDRAVFRFQVSVALTSSRSLWF